MYKIGSVFIGLLIAIMVTFNGALAKQIGDYPSVLIIHVVGLIAIILILVITNKKFNLDKRIPVWMFSAGAVGVFVVLFNNICVKNLGVSLTLSLGLIGQSLASGVIDHFGLIGMDVYKFRKKKIIGFGLAFIGIIIMVLY